ncbi:MAG: NAD(P)-dependent oxidoreductase [Candidatus Daviesbacteria bacterium]|nr:NAD(P)-dependent oxidoreductase [Candidatus Daviesbacteria bacterium]
MKKVLVFGGAGLVGSKFIDLNSQKFEINAPNVSELDILDKCQVLKRMERFNPDAVVNFAAFTNVGAAEDQKGDENGICFQINAIGAKNVAEGARDSNKYLIHISTEYVFDGTKANGPYKEEDKQNPINWYGETKYYGEQFVMESHCPLGLVRICMPFSPFYELKKDIARYFLDELKTGNQIKAIEDQKVTPTLVSDIADAIYTLINNQAQGIYHVCSKDSITPFEFAKSIAKIFNLDGSLVQPVTFEEYNKNKKGKLLKNSWLGCEKFISKFGDNILHKIEESLEIFKKETIDGSSV